ncbi:MAG: ATP-binding cassette domain-containing protein [Ruminococcaceae bacterium]|nr:ATP-binding cassette domain-containing protein [Oscillospiraceae bacterium]
MSSEHILTLENVSKHYKTKQALNSFKYEFKTGIYGLLGPNGAGKSTLMNIIAGLVKADKYSSVLYGGTETDKLGKSYRSILGYMPQQQNVFGDFTGVRFLSYMAALKGIPQKEAKTQITDLLKRLDLTDAANRRLWGYSGGMKQRILLAQALLGEPKILILDEPTAGVDPKQRVIIKNLIKGISEDKTVLFSTHIVSDIEQIADEIIFLKDGNIVQSGKAAELLSDIDLEGLYMKHFGDR